MKIDGSAYAYNQNTTYKTGHKTDTSGWQDILERVKEERAGDIQTDTRKEGDSDTQQLVQQIRKKLEEMEWKIKNGEIQDSFQIGASSFTLEEWEKFLTKFDQLEAEIRQLMEEEAEKMEETKKAEDLIKTEEKRKEV